MNNLKRLLLGAVFAAVALLLVMLAFTPDESTAAINRNDPLPQTWITSDGASSFGLTYQAVPVINVSGTNYTAISTNVAMTNALTLKVVRGLVVGVIADQ